MKVDPLKLAAARRVVRLMTPHVELTTGGGYWFSWAEAGRPVRLRWAVRGSGDYPVWYSRRPAGGTWCQAAGQLVRWLSGRPHLPLRVWRHWEGPVVKIGDGVAAELAAAGWPEDVPCVKCGRPITPRDEFDWYSHQPHPGPGCKPSCGRGSA